MKVFVLATLLLACATARTAPVRDARRWTPHVRATVQLSCEAHFGVGQLCDCLTEKLEVISPDPDTDFTPDDFKSGFSACGKKAVEPTGFETL
jgi:hypothetical protein